MSTSPTICCVCLKPVDPAAVTSRTVRTGTTFYWCAGCVQHLHEGKVCVRCQKVIPFGDECHNHDAGGTLCWDCNFKR